MDSHPPGSYSDAFNRPITVVEQGDSADQIISRCLNNNSDIFGLHQTQQQYYVVRLLDGTVDALSETELRIKLDQRAS